MGMIDRIRVLFGTRSKEYELRQRIKGLHDTIDQLNSNHRYRHEALMNARCDAGNAERQRDSVIRQYNDLAARHNAVCLKLQRVCSVAGEAGASINREGYTADGSRAFVAADIMDRLVNEAIINPEAAMAAHNDVLLSGLADQVDNYFPSLTVTPGAVASWLRGHAEQYRDEYRRHAGSE